MDATRRVIWLALIAGVLLRVVYFVWSRDLVFFDQPITDALYHHRWAQAIAGGALWDGQPFFRAPFYPYTLGLLYALVGDHIWVGKAFGHLAGLATGALIIVLARRLFDVRTAVVAAWLWLGSGLLVFFEGELLLDTYFTFLCVLSLLLMFGAQGRRRHLIACGLTLGLAAITRPTGLVLLPLYVVYLWRHGGPPRRALGLWAVGLLVPLAIVSGLNSYALGRPAGIATQGGINFYIGNNPSADGYTAVLPDPWGYAWSYVRLEQHARDVTGQPLDAVGVSDFYYAQGREFIAQNPLPFTALCIKKALLSLNRVTISNNLNIPYIMREIPLLLALPVRIWWLVTLALAGLAWRGSSSHRRYLWIYVALYTAVLTLFFITERFRLPLAPIWILLAAHGVSGAVDATGGRRLMAAALLAAGLVITVPNWYGLSPNNDALAYFNLGNAALRTGDNVGAVAYYDSATVRTNDLHQLLLNRGLARLRLGRPADAQADFEAEASRYAFDARPFNNLAALHLLQGDTVGAETAIDSGLARDSGLGLLYMQRLNITEARADTARLAATLAAAVRNAGAWPVWLWWQGELARLSGRPEAARTAYRKFASSATPWPTLDGEDRVYAGPTLAETDYRIGLTYLEPATVDSAEVYFARAARADSNLAEAWANWGTALLARGQIDSAVTRYRQAVRAQPRSPVLWTNLAWAHAQAGALDSALAATVQALTYDSTFGPARALELQLRRVP